MASTSDRIAEDKQTLARLDDALRACERYACQKCIGFLDAHKAALVVSRLKRLPQDMQWTLYGGHDEAERVFAVVSSTGEVVLEEVPLTSLECTWREHISLSHRDVLGSILACGIERDTVGDILCEPGRAVVFIQTDLAGYIQDSLRTIGREGVTVVSPHRDPLPVFHRYAEISGTVASARLDAVLKVLLAVSREQAADLIRQSLVQINHMETLSVTVSPNPGDVISVRGHGRFVIDDLSDTTRKGRVIVRARRFV